MQVNSNIFQIFFGNLNKWLLDAAAQSLFTVLKDRKLTHELYENVVCQAVLGQGYEIENVAATEGRDFLCKSAQHVITKFIDCESKNELLSGLQHVRNSDFHLELTDLIRSSQRYAYFTYFVFD